MVKTDKLVKYERHASKANKLALQVKKLQKKNAKSQRIGIKTYKKYLQKHKSKDTKYIVSKTKSKDTKYIVSKTKSKSKSKTKSKTKNNTLPIKKDNDNDILIRLSSRKSKIIQPDRLIIPEMEPMIPESTLVKTDKLPTKILPVLDNIFDNNYIIAIPSYKRADIIQTHTLAVLNRHKIKPECITIFVANQEEYDIYKAGVPSFLYNNLIIGVLGLKNQRNFISDYYPEGKYIVEMDDDIKSIMQLVIKKKTTSSISKSSNQKSKKSKKSKKSNFGKTVKPIEDLDAFIRRAFEMCTESNIFLWGVYPLVNPYFMTYKITTDLRFIVGPMWGMINRHRKDLKLTVDEKENSERTLQFWVADGSVLRFNNVGIETKYYKNKGGMQEEGKNRKEEALKSVYYLNKMYPTLTKISLTKKSGMPEIKMIHKKKI